MADVYGIPCAGFNGGNTGMEPCTEAEDKKVVGDILIPSGKTYPLNDMDALATQLKADAIAVNRALRIYPIFGYDETADQSTERQTAEMGYGSKFHSRDPIKGDQYWIGGQPCLQKAMVAFRNAHNAYDRIMVFEDGSIMGTLKKNEDGESVLGGFKLSQLWAGEMKMNDGGSTNSRWSMDYEHKFLAEWDKRVLALPAGMNVYTDLKGLKDISFDFVKSDPEVSGQYDLRLTSGCGRVAFGEIYATQLGSVTVWKAIVEAPRNLAGEEIEISSVSLVGGLNRAQLLTTDPNFSGATKIRFTLDDAALATAGVKGYESGYIVLPK